MKRRVFVVALLALGALLALAVGASAQRSVLPSSSCGPVQFKGSGKPDVIIASDLPLQGAGRSQTVEMTKAINFILAQHGYTVGKWTVGYQSCDDATPQAGKWDSGKAAANAQAYAADKSVVGVIGTFNSGAAQIEIPVLNRAAGGPVAMVSPANTYVGLTHAGPGTAPGEPGKYYPTGKRNYIRVVAADDFQGAADAILAQRLKRKSVYVLNDKEAYGLGVATNFRNAATKLGIKIAGFEAWDPASSSYEALATKIKQSGADSVFIGGLVCENGGKLVKDLAAGLGSGVQLMAPDGFTPISAVVEGAGTAAEGLTVSVAGLPNKQLKGAGKAFLAGFGKVIGKEPDPYSVYAAQAAEVLLAAIARSDGSRGSISAELFNTKIKNGLLGSFTINKNGDTSSNPVAIYKIKGGVSTDLMVIVPPVDLVAAA